MHKVTRLLIARHGNTFAPGDIVTRVGTTDLPLVASGLVQGEKLGVYLKQNNLIPDLIFTSQLKRAMQTAEQVQNVLKTNLPIQPLAIFNEIDYGPDENQPEEKVLARLGSSALHEWENHAKVPDGWNVNPNEIIKNWQEFATKLRQDYAGQTSLVITSNGIARFAPYLTGNFSEFTKQHSIKISTGALCLFANLASSDDWQCCFWNVRPENVNSG